jgi:hypothetical protein
MLEEGTMSRKQFENGDIRRGPLGWFPRLGMGLVAFAASTGYGGYTPPTGTCPPGFSGGGSFSDEKCCGVARLDNECCYPTGGSKADYICKPGYNKTMWFCLTGGIVYGCGECAKGNNCDAGPWDCSIVFEAQKC